MRDLRIVGARKEFQMGRRGKVAALEGVNLEVRAGELLAIVGPSGCGKTTLLRAIAGLEELTEGEIHLGSERIDLLPAAKRSISMAFQQPALYPQVTVAENIAFPLTLRKAEREEKTRRVREVAEQTRVQELLDRLPETLSGGEQQRVALARALVLRPEVLLLDEPLSNLDAQTRPALRREIENLHRATGVTCLFVTHDQNEAMIIGQRVAVMNQGKIVQCSKPASLYQRPENRFVAEFIGYPAMNFFPARLRSKILHVAHPEVFAAATTQETSVDHEVEAGIRPEDIILSANGHEATVDRVEDVGHESHVRCHIRNLHFTVRLRPGEITAGSKVRVEFRADRWHLFDVDSGQRIE